MREEHSSPTSSLTDERHDTVSQTEDRHCVQKTWIQKMDLKEQKSFSDEINTACIKNHQLLLQSM